MEMKFTPEAFELNSIMRIRIQQQNEQGKTDETPHSDSDENTSLSLSSLSKPILPPLGISSYNQNQIRSKGRIISPMDSRYR